MKISEITIENVLDYLRLDSDNDNTTVTAIMAAAKQYILSFTGLSADECDSFEDLSIAYFSLCADMYDNRTMIVSNDKVNPLVKQILGGHSVNYL